MAFVGSLTQLDHRARGPTTEELELPWASQRGGEVADFFRRLENIIGASDFRLEDG